MRGLTGLLRQRQRPAVGKAFKAEYSLPNHRAARFRQRLESLIGLFRGKYFIWQSANSLELTGISRGAVIDPGNFADLDRFAEAGTGGRLVGRGRVKSMTRRCENDLPRLPGGDCRHR